MKTIKSKVERALILVALLPVLILAGYVYYSTTDALKSASVSSLERQVQLLSGSAFGVLKHVPGDLSYLRDSASMFQYGRALVIKDQKILDVNGRSLSRDFLSLAKNRRIYNQLRFVGADGNELIRIEHNEDEGFSRVLQPEQLRDKSNSLYFREAAKLEFGQVYISPIDLNREDGELEDPVRPTIRFATPVFAVGNRLVGVLILNVDASAFLNQIKAASTDNGIQFTLVDDHGYYLANSDTGLEWGSARDLNHGKSMSTERPMLSREVLAADGIVQIDLSDDLVATSPLFADESNQHQMGRLVAIAPKSVVLKLLDSFVIALAVFVVLAVVMAFVIAKMLSSSLTNPLIYLTQAADRLSKGEVDTAITIHSNDEVQRLAEAFERLRESVKILMKLG
ncbi:HAMP domain-containing protein [Pontibacterium sp. N1Y112]|uniref:histidine kinase n=1 Tax=Pontibacterium sinense TaxID=2781979 RepID=A0A8J7FNI6_9GAMM|nr:HAMP domain-containing protein [Pontibacterium sinense]